MPAQVVALVAAAVSAAAFGLSTSLQHLVSSRLDHTRSRHMLASLVRTPLWLLGIALSLGAFALHALALAEGSLDLVQPVVVTGVVFAVLMRSGLERRWPSRAEVLWAVVSWAGLSAFLVGTGSPSPSGSVAHAGASVLVVLLLAGGSGLVARRQSFRSTGRGFWLGVVSGLLFGLVAVLLKLALAAGGGLAAALEGWPLWLMVVCGVAAVAVNQRAYQSTRLSVSMPVLNIVDVLVAIVLAAVVFGEEPRFGTVPLLLEVTGLLAMALGVLRLARLEELEPGLAPAGSERTDADHPASDLSESDLSERVR